MSSSVVVVVPFNNLVVVVGRVQEQGPENKMIKTRMNKCCEIFSNFKSNERRRQFPCFVRSSTQRVHVSVYRS